MAKRSGAGHARRGDPGNPSGRDVDVLDLDAALTRLAAFDPRRSQLAELRFFGGLSLAEASEALGISMATAERDWRAARAWLLRSCAVSDGMTPERWRQVTEVFHAALARDTSARARYLDRACAGVF